MTTLQVICDIIACIFFVIGIISLVIGNSETVTLVSLIFSFSSALISIADYFNDNPKPEKSTPKLPKSTEVYNQFGPENTKDDNNRKKLIAIIVLSIFFLVLILCSIFKYSAVTREPPLPTKSLVATTKVTAINVKNGIKVSWNEVEGAKYYKVYRDGELAYTTSGLEVTDKAVKRENGIKHTYEVIASTTRDSNNGDSEKSRTAKGCRLSTVGIEKLENIKAGRMKVTYGKNDMADGYVLLYSLNSDMSDPKSSSIKGADKLSMAVDVEKGKTYYVQVRVYKKDNDGDFYSAYCTTKSIEITK